MAAAATFPPDHPRSVACPTCQAKAGSPCMRPSGHRLFGGISHAGRMALVSSIPTPPPADPADRYSVSRIRPGEEPRAWTLERLAAAVEPKRFRYVEDLAAGVLAKLRAIDSWIVVQGFNPDRVNASTAPRSVAWAHDLGQSLTGNLAGLANRREAIERRYARADPEAAALFLAKLLQCLSVTIGEDPRRDLPIVTDSSILGEPMGNTRSNRAGRKPAGKRPTTRAGRAAYAAARAAERKPKPARGRAAEAKRPAPARREKPRQGRLVANGTHKGGFDWLADLCHDEMLRQGLDTAGLAAKINPSSPETARIQLSYWFNGKRRLGGSDQVVAVLGALRLSVGTPLQIPPEPKAA